MTHSPSLIETLGRAALGVGAIGGIAMLGGAALSLLLPGGSPPADTIISAAPSTTAPSPTPPTAGGVAPSPSDDVAPEAATGVGPSGVVYAADYMMVAAHPVASHVGARVLDEGGSAVDALIASQMVLNLVEPQSSGIGGGGFLLVWNPATETLQSYDGRETAPAAGTSDYIRDETGAFREFREALTGGASVGVPGLTRMLELAHEDFGVQPWNTLFTPAIELAEAGFPVSPRLHKLIAGAEYLDAMEPAASYFFMDGAPLPIGHVRTNPEFAETLRAIADQGAAALHQGPIAERIVDAVRRADRNPGALTLQDLATYQAKRRGALCLNYRVYRVCGMPPPSSGGSTVLQILGFLEYSGRDIREAAPYSADSVHLFTEAMRLAFADRNMFLADTDFVSVPLAEMMAVPYLARRAGTMDFTNAAKAPRRAGNPMGDRAALPRAPDTSIELPSTTHLVAVDRDGRVATMTTSIEQGFGSRVMVGGFLLNNQLTDFAWREIVDGKPVANRYEPGKRPRSSMAPTLVLGPEGTPRLALGSPGGSRIIGYVAKTLIGVLDWEMSIQEAIEAPHFLNRNGPLELEDRPELDAIATILAQRGYDVRRPTMASGLHGIEFAGGLLIGGADPRREGLAVGEANLERDLDTVFKRLLGADH